MGKMYQIITTFVDDTLVSPFSLSRDSIYYALVQKNDSREKSIKQVNIVTYKCHVELFLLLNLGTVLCKFFRVS